MLNRILIGNKIISLNEVDSTNEFLKNYLLNRTNEPEGLVVNAKSQYAGKGQRGNLWKTNPNENLTFSVLLQPGIDVSDQFTLTKIISLSIIDFLTSKGVKAKVKWPNDIYVGNKKIGGILIENTVKQSKINYSVVGVGININQMSFNESLPNPISMSLINEKVYNLENLLQEVLDYIDKRYLVFKTKKQPPTEEDYLSKLYRFQEEYKYSINEVIYKATIIGVTSSGKLTLKIGEETKSFDLKELSFLV